MSRYSAAPHGAAGQVILTRQGISLNVLLPQLPEADVAPCNHVVPACRHADGTISSSGVLDVRRMASEDSDQFGPGLLAVHRLSDLRDIGQSLEREVPARIDHLHATSELRKVALLRRPHRVLPEERDDRVDQLRSPPNHVAVQVFPMVVVSLVCEDLTNPEEARELA
jgi:hypothetical protein